MQSDRKSSRILCRWYELVIENKDDLVTLTTSDNNARSDASGKVLFAASFLEWFAEEVARIYGDVFLHSSTAYHVSIVKEPVGVCGLIAPLVSFTLCHSVLADEEHV